MEYNRYNILSETDEEETIEKQILKKLGIYSIPNIEYDKYYTDIPQNKQLIIDKKIKEKKMLCISVLKSQTTINIDSCIYGNKCSYAHSILDQRIETKREEYYKIIFNKHNTIKSINKELFKELNVLCDVCDECYNNVCQGGLNCKKGVYRPYFKICRNDFYGNCINTLMEINIDRTLIQTLFPSISLEDHYLGCINGHHLSERGIHKQKEVENDNKIRLVRLIRTIPYINTKENDDSDSDIDLQELHQIILNDENN